MPRNYKTGPARSRRRPDPSTIVRTTSQQYPVQDSLCSGGVGTVDVEVQLHDPATGEISDNLDWAMTGVPSNAYVIDSAGTRHPLTMTSVSVSGLTAYQQLTGIPAGSAYIVLPGNEPAAANPIGHRFGTFVLEVTVT